jgi:hypothetical protein
MQDRSAMTPIEITSDALALAAYISNAVRVGRDAQARETGGQILELQPHFRVSQAQENLSYPLTGASRPK